MIDPLYDAGFLAGEKAERERCAKIADSVARGGTIVLKDVSVHAGAAEAVAAAIRNEDLAAVSDKLQQIETYAALLESARKDLRVQLERIAEYASKLRDATDAALSEWKDSCLSG